MHSFYITYYFHKVMCFVSSAVIFSLIPSPPLPPCPTLSLTWNVWVHICVHTNFLLSMFSLFYYCSFDVYCVLLRLKNPTLFFLLFYMLFSIFSVARYRLGILHAKLGLTYEKYRIQRPPWNGLISYLEVPLYIIVFNLIDLFTVGIITEIRWNVDALIVNMITLFYFLIIFPYLYL